MITVRVIPGGAGPERYTFTQYCANAEQELGDVLSSIPSGNIPAIMQQRGYDAVIDVPDGRVIDNKKAKEFVRIYKNMSVEEVRRYYEIIGDFVTWCKEEEIPIEGISPTRIAVDKETGRTIAILPHQGVVQHYKNNLFGTLPKEKEKEYTILSKSLQEGRTNYCAEKIGTTGEGVRRTTRMGSQDLGLRGDNKRVLLNRAMHKSVVEAFSRA